MFETEGIVRCPLFFLLHRDKKICTSLYRSLRVGVDVLTEAAVNINIVMRDIIFIDVDADLCAGKFFRLICQIAALERITIIGDRIYLAAHQDIRWHAVDFYTHVRFNINDISHDIVAVIDELLNGIFFLLCNDCQQNANE